MESEGSKEVSAPIVRTDEPVSERVYDKPGLLIEFQYGPIKDFGRNGCQVEDIIEIAIKRLKFFERHDGGKLRCRENSLAITKLEEGLLWLSARTARREGWGVEGRYLVHKS